MTRSLCGVLAAVTLFIFGFASNASAIPTFSRKYQTSCSTCHYAYPKLNKFGRTFLNNGFRYPEGEDPSYTKEEPTKLGADSYKQVFPDAIWPSDIPGTGPVSLRLINRTNFRPVEPKSSFEFPHELEFLFGGTLGESFSFFGEVEYEHADEFAYGFYLQYNAKPGFNIKVGTVDPAPIPDHMRLTASHFGYLNMRVSDSGWRLRDGQSGLELWGAMDGPNGRGGFKYQFGMVNGQNTDSNDDVDSDKDFYSIFSYKFGGLGRAGGTEAASASSAFWKDNSFTIGINTYNGNSTYGDGFENSFSVFGVFADIWLGRLNLWNATQFHTDDNPKANSLMERKGLASSTEADFVLYPWLIGFARYDYIDSYRGDGVEATKYVVPGLTAMIRANVKVTFEMQLRLDEAGEKKDKYVIGVDFAM
ncbi:MAG: hypothetical protein FVQ81_03350 [Candidatus Glassbacteria bacterium]|nr:hypothetical protein [Candidatus Glassbacteria bacterium]